MVIFIKGIKNKIKINVSGIFYGLRWQINKILCEKKKEKCSGQQDLTNNQSPQGIQNPAHKLSVIQSGIT